MSDVRPQDPLWPQVGQSLGPWLILRHHDLEGSGDMFLAKRRDGAFEREVLITLQRPLPPGSADDGEFLAERELQGRLDHPGIAKVLGAGRTQSGLPYLVTEYLDGPDIEAHLNFLRAPVADRIESIQQVCQAVQHAHEKGICGLNLQASNVHRVPDGSLRIVVFGLAHWNRPQAMRQNAPERGPLRGGPIFAGEYASPEQWSGLKPEPTSDVYSLGALLYRVLTGSSPHRLTGLTPAAARIRVQRGAVTRASSRVRLPALAPHAEHCSTTTRQLSGQLKGDLDRILDKALNADPKKRYGSAKELSEDLDRHLAGVPIRARGPAPIYVLGRNLRRYRWPVTLFLVVASVLAWALERSIASGREAQIALIEAREMEAKAEGLGLRLRQLCVQLLTELGPSMQGQPGLEDARRYLLSVGAPLLDQLRGSGREDLKLAMHVSRSFVDLAEADYAARDVDSVVRSPDSAERALSLCSALITSVPAAQKKEAGECYARAVRSAAWFAHLTLDERRGRAVVEGISKQLQAAQLEELEMAPCAQLALGEARRTYYASQMNYERALGAWDPVRLRALAGSTPMEFRQLKAELARMEAIVAEDLLEAGRTREALEQWNQIVQRLERTHSAQPPTLLNSLGQETHAWVQLAEARQLQGEAPGAALSGAGRYLETIRSQLAREPGAKLILADAELGLGSRKLSMGPAANREAIEHLDRAANTLREILSQGSRWPLLYLNLAEVHRLRARALFQDQRQEAARQALEGGENALQNLPPHATDHIQALAMGCGLQLERFRQQGLSNEDAVQGFQSDLYFLRQRGASPAVCDRLAAEMESLRTRTRPSTPGGAPPK